MLFIITIFIKECENSSSPVEKVHHNDLVTIVDSIINSRSTDYNYVEDDDISNIHDSLGRILMPKGY